MPSVHYASNFVCQNCETISETDPNILLISGQLRNEQETFWLDLRCPHCEELTHMSISKERWWIYSGVGQTGTD